MRNKFIWWAVALIAVFLAGYVPQAVKSSKLEADLRLATRQNQEAQLRDLIGLTYLQAVQKNYGLAAQNSTLFFNRVQEMAAKAGDARQKKQLEDIFSYRDNVTAALARGEPGVPDDLQNLLLKTRAATTP